MNIRSISETDKKKLAFRCQMGDVAAMMDLAKLFLANTSEVCRRLADAYGAGEESRKEFLQYLEEHPNEKRNVLAGNMWVTRAAIYGHPEAKRLFMSNSVYEECTLIPMVMFLIGSGRSRSLPTEELRYAGLLDFPENTVVNLYLQGNGSYMATADAGTDGPDESGFGMEELYDFYYFDEFFHRLHILAGWSNFDVRMQKVSPFEGKLESALRERERYWETHAGKDGAIRYVDQPYSAAHDYTVRSGVLTKCLKKGMKHAEIPFGVEKIGDNAFRSCLDLESVTIPITVTEIGEGAFAGCASLKRVDFPDTLETVGRNAFDGCKSLSIDCIQALGIYETI